MLQKKGNEARVVLKVSLPSESISVSYLSNLLRVMQAALRETAVQSEDTSDTMEGGESPVLCQTISTLDNHTCILMYFTNRHENANLIDFTALVVTTFVNGLNNFLNGNAQTSLWGFAVADNRSSKDTPLTKRYRQVVKTMKRMSGASLSSGTLSIVFKDDTFGVV